MSVRNLDVRDLWLDGRCYSVPHQVWAHVAFLQDQVSQFADKLAGAVDNRPDPHAVRWTPNLKARLAIAALQSDAHRAAVKLLCEISDTELETWIARHAQFGKAGLQQGKIQALRPS